MDYHSEFWVAVAAAGPILLLATAVTVNIYDFWGPLRSVYKAWFAEDIRAVREGQIAPSYRPHGTLSAAAWDARQSYVRWAAWSQGVSWLGFLTAAVATVLALISLARLEDTGPTWFPIVLLVVAGGCIPVQSGIAGIVRAKAKQGDVEKPLITSGG